MSTKFVSKNSNYMVVLKPGIEGNRNLGTHAVPGLYIKFQSGVVDIKEDRIVDLMREHPSFGTDFVEVKQEEIDPFSDTREETEPGHVISEIKYGHNEKAASSPAKVKMSPALKKIIEGEAMKMLPDLLKSNPAVLKELIMGLASEMKANDAKKEVVEDEVDEDQQEEAADETIKDEEVEKEEVKEEKVVTAPKKDQKK
ncbi:MAG: hypothetical protein WC069_05990 [Candidatus Shapirobacteria bacterium]